MNYHVMTLFPEMIDRAMSESIIGRAREKGLIQLEVVNIRDFSADKHRHVDDYPYGGGAGMVMQPGPVYDCWKSITDRIGSRARVIYTTPQGRVFNQETARELAQEDELIFLCGHYEGVDERVLEEIVTDNISIGDFVLTGGELPALVMMDAIARLVPGVLHNKDSAGDESFENGLLEYPQYTRPEVFRGKKVPDILLSGHHENIDRWRHNCSLERTYRRRPDLIAELENSGNLSDDDINFVNCLKRKLSNSSD